MPSGMADHVRIWVVMRSRALAQFTLRFADCGTCRAITNKNESVAY
jgi:hypothetical protein